MAGSGVTLAACVCGSVTVMAGEGEQSSGTSTCQHANHALQLLTIRMKQIFGLGEEGWPSNKVY